MLGVDELLGVCCWVMGVEDFLRVYDSLDGKN